jgi:hypothetical protein
MGQAICERVELASGSRLYTAVDLCWTCLECGVMRDRSMTMTLCYPVSLDVTPQVRRTESQYEEELWKGDASGVSGFIGWWDEGVGEEKELLMRRDCSSKCDLSFDPALC